MQRFKNQKHLFTCSKYLPRTIQYNFQIIPREQPRQTTYDAYYFHLARPNFQQTVSPHRPFVLLQPSHAGWPKSAQPAKDLRRRQNRASSRHTRHTKCQSLEYKGQSYVNSQRIYIQCCVEKGKIVSTQ